MEMSLKPPLDRTPKHIVQETNPYLQSLLRRIEELAQKTFRNIKQAFLNTKRFRYS